MNAKSDLASQATTLVQVGTSIAYAVVDNGGTDKDTTRVISDEQLAKDIAMLILGRAELVIKPNPLLGTDMVLWSQWYAKHLGITVDFSGLKIPAKPTKGNWRLLVIANGLTNNQVYDVCAKQFKCRSRGDLNKEIPTNERDPIRDGSYAIWVRDEQEADEVHQNKSANMVKEADLKTETFLERAFHELVYFLETGKHLDVKKVTLCSGSRSSDGNVPSARWYDDEFFVYWYDVGDRDECLRPREVVS